MSASTGVTSVRGRNSRRALAVVLVGVFLAGMAVRGFLASPSAPSGREATSASGPNLARSGPGPRSYTNGIPIGFAHSKAGARAAAAGYVLTGHQLLSLAPTLVPDAIRVMAASDSADDQVREVGDEIRRLRSVLDSGSGPIQYVQAVLATRLDAYTDSRARISVWSVGVLARSGAAQPQAGWNRSTFELVWEHGDWKIWSESVVPGPAPILNGGAKPATNAEFDQLLDGFEPWQQERVVSP